MLKSTIPQTLSLQLEPNPVYCCNYLTTQKLNIQHRQSVAKQLTVPCSLKVRMLAGESNYPVCTCTRDLSLGSGGCGKDLEQKDVISIRWKLERCNGVLNKAWQISATWPDLVDAWRRSCHVWTRLIASTWFFVFSIVSLLFLLPGFVGTHSTRCGPIS